jgi:hypothetical protein
VKHGDGARRQLARDCGRTLKPKMCLLFPQPDQAVVRRLPIPRRAPCRRGPLSADFLGDIAGTTTRLRDRPGTTINIVKCADRDRSCLREWVLFSEPLQEVMISGASC